MNASLHRRITVACCWAASRISVLDSLERYEDSYAVTQEFREWITSLDQNDRYLEESVLPIPKITNLDQSEESETDEALEI